MILRPRLEILVATRNIGKICEIQEALRSLPVNLRYLDEFPNVATVDEIGQTYEENAVLKAMNYSNQIGIYALADDSGLEVDALGGMPGVLTARFAGARASDAERINMLLAALSEYPAKKRSARFVCSMALAGYENDHETPITISARLLKVSEGRCEGVIADTSRGSNGFGFYPVFMTQTYDETFAELSDEVKSRISHRALAIRPMRAFLERRLAL
jgi:XTP/dITP diphosphohydrolase